MKHHLTIFTIVLSIFFLNIPAATADKSGVGPTVLSLPSGPGSLGGVGENVQANLNMGLMSYSIPIVVPPGRGRATPSVGLSYSSSGGVGLVGIGWSFNAGGSVSRLTVRGLPTYTNNDRFYSGGELVKIPGSPFYRARVEGGFVRYSWIQKDSNDQRGYWLAENSDGSKEYYGANSKGEIDLDAQIYGLKGTFQWELRTYVDPDGKLLWWKGRLSRHQRRRSTRYHRHPQIQSRVSYQYTDSQRQDEAGYPRLSTVGKGNQSKSHFRRRVGQSFGPDDRLQRRWFHRHGRRGK